MDYPKPLRRIYSLNRFFFSEQFIILAVSQKKKIMKKLLFILLPFFFISCQPESKNSGSNDALPETPEKGMYEITGSEIKWTAYKTTAKVPVGGTFTDVEWKNFVQAGLPEQALRKLYFKINTRSIFTDHPDRDKTLFEYLFAKMLEGNYIEGRVAGIDTGAKKIKVVLRMNGLEKALDFPYVKNDSVIHAATVIDLEKDFQAGEALYFLHTACKDLHTGEDGISKTWSEVKIEADFYYKKLQ